MYVPQHVRGALDRFNMGGLLPEDTPGFYGDDGDTYYLGSNLGEGDEGPWVGDLHGLSVGRLRSSADAIRAAYADGQLDDLINERFGGDGELFSTWLDGLTGDGREHRSWGQDKRGRSELQTTTRVTQADLDVIRQLNDQYYTGGGGGLASDIGSALGLDSLGGHIEDIADSINHGIGHAAEQGAEEVISAANTFDEEVVEPTQDALDSGAGYAAGVLPGILGTDPPSTDGGADDAERERQEAHEQAVRTGVERLREMYGYGETAMARSNRSRIDRMIRDQKEALAGMQADQAMDAYADAQVGQRAAFARSGNVGGGAQQAQSRRNTGNLVQSFQGIQGNARQYGTQIQSQLDQDLLQQENNILQSEVAPELYFQPQRLARNMRSAQSTAPQLALQSLFNSGANMVMVDAQSRGMGRQGLFGGGG